MNLRLKVQADKLSAPRMDQRSQPGYYPGYSTLSQQGYWDESTRRVVSSRVAPTPSIRFFSAEQATLLEAIVNRLVPQDDRTGERRIPIVPRIDERLFKNALSGFRYEDMPPDREAYHLGLRAIDDMSRKRFHRPFPELDAYRQDAILKSLHDSEPDPTHEAWKRMPVHRFWSMMLADCADAYYSHPWSWDEIGYGGPAYPRGYMRLENGLPEPWEVDEVRYEWSAPAGSLSDLHLEPNAKQNGEIGTEPAR